MKVQRNRILGIVNFALMALALIAPAGRTEVKPCCAITHIDAATGIVTAQENATGRVFTIKVADAALLHSLKVGQGIYANFATKQVSIDGKSPAGTILTISPIGRRPGGFPNVASGSGAPSGSGSSGTSTNSGNSNPTPVAPSCSQSGGTSNHRLRTISLITAPWLQFVSRRIAARPQRLVAIRSQQEPRTGWHLTCRRHARTVQRQSSR